MDSWWKTPWQFFCFFFTPLCVCVCLHVWRWRAGVVKHRFSKEGRGVVWGGGAGRRGRRRVLCSASHPLLSPCGPATAHRRLAPLVTGEGRVGRWGIRGCPFAVKPGASASVRKGIWRAWWKPPCYLARVRRGESHASLTT